jgi:hypothetical protein
VNRNSYSGSLSARNVADVSGLINRLTAHEVVADNCKNPRSAQRLIAHRPFYGGEV